MSSYHTGTHVDPDEVAAAGRTLSALTAARARLRAAVAAERRRAPRERYSSAGGRRSAWFAQQRAVYDRDVLYALTGCRPCTWCSTPVPLGEELCAACDADELRWERAAEARRDLEEAEYRG